MATKFISDLGPKSALIAPRPLLFETVKHREFSIIHCKPPLAEIEIFHTKQGLH